MEPELAGHLTLTCFPSIASTQLVREIPCVEEVCGYCFESISRRFWHVMSVKFSPQDEATDNLPEIQECSVSQDAGPSFETQVRSKRKRKSKDDDYYEKLCKIEQKKLDILSDREARRKSDADREDEDRMFLKTLLPHIRKIPQHMKLRFHSRIQSVVEEFAYGPQPAMYQSYTYSSTPSPVDSDITILIPTTPSLLI
ncbi:transcription factor adf-1 [Plakobranchus ocellatus]|uniref:Transcription factor adf-1 n=1 Tax=Plakobranchus ocellatus TaxID=259542 RepID=A0AAV4AK27_9GAST|nr:transcription factor adf-1 [Plakobranchus ocellatus]